MDSIKNEGIIKTILVKKTHGRGKKKKVIIGIIKYIKWQIWSYDQRLEYELIQSLIHHIRHGFTTSPNKSTNRKRAKQQLIERSNNVT